MRPVNPRLEVLRRSFWLYSSIAFVTAFLLGWLVPALHGWLYVDVPLLQFHQEGSAATALQTIATVSMSVAGISFSVVVVALQLAAQQLSPRVLRTFQADRPPQLALALFVGTFIYCLVALARLGAVGGEAGPDLVVAVALLLATVAFAYFIVFIHHIVNVLQASDLIRRIASDAQFTVERRYPDDIGEEPPSLSAGEEAVQRSMDRREPIEISAPRAGYLVGVDPRVMKVLSESDALLEQLVMIGDFVVTGQRIARLWIDGGPGDAPVERIRRSFDLAHERNVVQDAAFPVRQLADIALKGLSPSLNDPTTAENAMNSIADTLVRFAARGDGVPVRLDESGQARFVAQAPTLNDLTRLGFDQARVKAATYPQVAVRMAELLRLIRDAALASGTDCQEAERQAELLSAGADRALPSDADVERVRMATAAVLDGPRASASRFDLAR